MIISDVRVKSLSVDNPDKLFLIELTMNFDIYFILKHTLLLFNTDCTTNKRIVFAPDWHYADAWQLKDYTDLGGVGVPNCE